MVHFRSFGGSLQPIGELKIKRQVLDTEGVERITDYSANVDPDMRKLTITIGYRDIYGNEQQANYASSS